MSVAGQKQRQCERQRRHQADHEPQEEARPWLELEEQAAPHLYGHHVRGRAASREQAVTMRMRVDLFTYRLTVCRYE